MSQRTRDERFYDALKNAQPIVFLASFAMIIAVFSSSNEEIAGVYNNSVLASIMFLVSFGFSLYDQLFRREDDDIWLRGGKYFFFIIGVLYLAIIAFEFSKPLPQTFVIILYWGVIAIGISSYYPIHQKMGKLDPKFYYNPKHYTIAKTLGIFGSFSFIMLGIISIGDAFLEFKLEKEILELIQIGFFISAFVFFTLEFITILTVQKRKKKLN